MLASGGALSVWLCVAALCGAAAMSSATVVSAPAAFGSTKDGTPAYVYTLKSEVSPKTTTRARARARFWPCLFVAGTWGGVKEVARRV